MSYHRTHIRLWALHLQNPASPAHAPSLRPTGYIPRLAHSCYRACWGLGSERQWYFIFGVPVPVLITATFRHLLVLCLNRCHQGRERTLGQGS